MRPSVHMDRHSSEMVTVHLLIDYDEQEKIALSANNNAGWQQTAISHMSASAGYGRHAWACNNPKFYEFVNPGVIAECFGDYYAKALEHNFMNLWSPQIARRLSQITYSWKRDVLTDALRERNSLFGGGSSYGDPYAFLPPGTRAPMKDVTPVVPSATQAAPVPALPAPQPALPAPPAPIPLGPPQVPIRHIDTIATITRSRINLSDFVRDKLMPISNVAVPVVVCMQWHFDDPKDDQDTELRLYLVFSQDERALIKKWGLNQRVLSTEPLFDDEALKALEEAQVKEMECVEDEASRASIAIEHKQQLSAAKEAKFETTLETWLAYPYRRRFKDMYTMMNYRRHLNQELTALRKNLAEYKQK